MKRSVKLTALALAAPSLLSCAGVPDDDAGDVAFVHQAVQTLLCRRPRGVDEVQALVDIAVENAPDGRAAVVDVLLEQPEFVDCWTSVLIDAMQMQRSSELTQLETCIDEPVYIVDGTGAPCAAYADCSAQVDALVAHLSDIPATAASLGGDWNLNDAVRAGLLADDLHIAWRPWLFALAGAPSASVTYNASTREIRDNFMSTAFATKVDCIGCHSTTYSKSEVYPGYSTPLNPANPTDPNAHQNSWDRTATLGFDLHGDAFGTTATTVPIVAGDPGSIAFQANCIGCHGNNGRTLPTDLCVNAGPSPKRLTERVPLLTVEAIEAQIVGGGGCMGPVPGAAASAHDIAVFLRSKLGGWEEVSRYVEDAQFSGPSGPWGMPPALCGFEWGPDQIADGASHSIGGYSTSFTDISDVTYVVKQGLAALPAEAGGGVTPQTRVGPDIPSMTNRKAAVAGLLVENIADDLLEELTGTRTSVAHGLPRMKFQADTLRTLASKLVVSDAGGVRISLKNALREALLSKFFNRRTPKDMQPAAPHLTDWAYQMPMYFDPWSATVNGVPTDDGNNLNGQGDIVHRRSPNRLTWSLHHDLGWPRPAVFPLPTGTFPSKELMRQVGRYESSVRPGTTMWRMDSLLLWEEELSACRNPDPATPDFINVLVDGNYATATLGDLALALKDRLLQDPVFSTETFGPGGEAEAELVEDYLDAVITGLPAATLASPANSWTNTKVTQAMRKYCGALLVSPDYLMANLPTVTTLAAAPPVVACLPGEPCSRADHLSHYCASLPAPYTCPP